MTERLCSLKNIVQIVDDERQNTVLDPLKKRRDNYRKGIRAYAATDYETARHLLLGFAEDGDAEAQSMIASMYQLGLGGLPVDDEKAVRFYFLASENGNGLASNNLGTLALLRG